MKKSEVEIRLFDEPVITQVLNSLLKKSTNILYIKVDNYDDVNFITQLINQPSKWRYLKSRPVIHWPHCIGIGQNFEKGRWFNTCHCEVKYVEKKEWVILTVCEIKELAQLVEQLIKIQIDIYEKTNMSKIIKSILLLYPKLNKL